MRTYICKYLLCGMKFCCRVQAHSFSGAHSAAEDAMSIIGGRIVSISECRGAGA